MKRKAIYVLGVVVLMSMTSLGLAQDGELHGTIDLTYQSKYVWRGFDVFGDKSAIQPSVDLDLYGTGFGINVAGHRANSGGYENSERWDYNLYYSSSLFEDEAYATYYRLGYVYYNYPDNSSHTKNSVDLQELHTILSWPKICPMGVVPSYVLVKLWPSNSGTAVGSASPTGGTASGWAHIFMFDYGLKMACPVTGEDRVLNLHSEIVYNDGVHPGGGNADQDWSNAVIGVSTGFDLGNNLTFTPGVYYQVTMDDSVNPDKDETWLTLSMKYAF